MDYTAQGLVAWCISVLGRGYVYGTYFSGIITQKRIDQKAVQYPDMFARRITYKGVTKTVAEWAQQWIGMNAGDCVGMIKAYYWTDDTGRVVYGYQGRADTSADGMLRRATVKGPISSMPDRLGLAVHYPGHIGVYIGGGKVIEARSVTVGVVETMLSFRSPAWTSWLEVPYVDYTGEVDTVLQRGSKGAAVRGWQIRLMQWNVNALPRFKADSDFGGETEDWTNRFKASVSMEQNGIVDDLTWDAMVEVLKGDQAELELVRAQLAAEQGKTASLTDRLASADATSARLTAERQKMADALHTLKSFVTI